MDEQRVRAIVREEISAALSQAEKEVTTAMMQAGGEVINKYMYDDPSFEAFAMAHDAFLEMRKVQLEAISEIATRRLAVEECAQVGRVDL